MYQHLAFELQQLVGTFGMDCLEPAKDTLKAQWYDQTNTVGNEQMETVYLEGSSSHPGLSGPME